MHSLFREGIRIIIYEQSTVIYEMSVVLRDREEMLMPTFGVGRLHYDDGVDYYGES